MPPYRAPSAKRKAESGLAPRASRPALIEEGNGGSEVISNQFSGIRVYDVPCSSFAMCRLEFHPCATNMLDLDADSEVDTNGVPIGQWYSSTNIIRWQAEAGHIYVPEWSPDLVNWYSNRYLSTNTAGLLETVFYNYVNDGPNRFYRIRRAEAQFPFPSQ